MQWYAIPNHPSNQKIRSSLAIHHHTFQSLTTNCCCRKHFAPSRPLLTACRQLRMTCQSLQCLHNADRSYLLRHPLQRWTYRREHRFVHSAQHNRSALVSSQLHQPELRRSLHSARVLVLWNHENPLRRCHCRIVKWGAEFECQLPLDQTTSLHRDQ